VAGKKTSIERDNVKHNKASKIKVAKLVRKKTVKDDENAAEKLAAAEINQSKWESGRQILFTILPIFGYRMISKLDLKNEKVIQICRLVFVGYLLLSQLLFWLLKKKIEAADDDTALKLPPKLSLQSLQGNA
jgi:hypothetical protein